VGIRIEQAEAVEAVIVQLEMNAAGEVVARSLLADAELGGPSASNLIEIVRLKTVIA
jgi:hypothetical protein